MPEPYRMPTEAERRYNPAAPNGAYGPPVNHLEAKAFKDLIESEENNDD